MTHILAADFEHMQNDNPNGSPMIRGYNIIGGKLEVASDGATFTSSNPALLSDTLGEFPLSTKADVHSALKAARSAFPSWAGTPAPTRGQIIGNMGRLLMDRKDALVRLETREIGKTLKESAGEIQEAIDTCLFSSPRGGGSTARRSTVNSLTKSCSPTEGRSESAASSTLATSHQRFHSGR